MTSCFKKDSSCAGVIHLHGYRVQSNSIGGQKFAFELQPPDPKMKNFFFHAESDYDKKRLVIPSSTSTLNLSCFFFPKDRLRQKEAGDSF